MHYRTLGKTGIPVSMVGIETHQWSGMGGKLFSEHEVREILSRALSLGINLIDTGECYYAHAAEGLIGAALGSRRKNFIIATKFGHRNEADTLYPAWTTDSVLRSLEESLVALRTDYLDIYHIHLNAAGDGAVFLRHIDAVGEALARAKAAGKIRFVGVCVGDNELYDAEGVVLTLAAQMLDLSVVQMVYNRLDRAAETHIIPIAATRNLGVICRAPLAKGYLSSRFRPQRDFDRRRLEEVSRIKEEEVPAGVDLAEWAIAWCLRQRAIASVVPGCSAPEQLDSTVRALALVKDE